MRPAQVSAAEQIENFSLSPKGERALFVARGDIFTAPIEKGPTRNLTNSSSAHDKWARWSPDGAKIAFISDLDGEDEVYLANQDGSGKPEQLTHGFHAMLYAPEWAPDGKYLYYVADHDFQPALSQIEFNFATDRASGIFAFALRKDVKNPFPPESDEVTIAKEGEKSADEKAKPEEKKDDKKDQKKDE